MKATLLASATVAALLASAANAADPAEPTVEPSETADVITIFATRNPTEAFDYPGSVTVLERDIIEDFNLSSISDLFAAVPGANFDSGPRRTGDTPSVRGVGGGGVLIYFDGARQNFISGHDGRAFIDPELLKAVEVVRGPTSALYGSGALGGVIAFRTITADDVLSEGETAAVRLGAGYQSINDEWRYTGTGVFRTPDGAFDAIGSLTFRESSDIELGSGDDLPADDEILSSLLKATARPADGLEISATWQRFDGETVDPSNPQGANTAGAGNELVDRTIDGETIQGVLSFRPAASNLIDLNLTAYSNTTTVEEAEVASTRVVEREVETLGFALDNRSRFSLGEQLNVVFTYGGEYYVDEQTGTDTDATDGSRGGVPDAESRFTGVFAQAEIEAVRPLGAPGVLTLIPGVRWDRFENEAIGQPDTDDDAVSPKVGLSYAPVPQLLIFANWAEAFRAPNFNEIYADGVHFSLPDPAAPPGPPVFVSNDFITNEDLGPEESETYEVGLGVDFEGVFGASDRFTAKASYYNSQVDDLINLEVNIPAGCFGAPFPPCGSGQAFGNFSRYANVQNAEIDGLEIEASYDSDLFYTRANFSSIEGEDRDTGEFIGSLQPDTVFIDAGLKLAAVDARLGGRLTLADEFDKTDDPNQFRDSYAKGDIYLVWTPELVALKGLRVDLGVDNVTDADYEVVAAGVSQPGRNYKAAVRWGATF